MYRITEGQNLGCLLESELITTALRSRGAHCALMKAEAKVCHAWCRTRSAAAAHLSGNKAIIQTCIVLASQVCQDGLDGFLQCRMIDSGWRCSCWRAMRCMTNPRLCVKSCHGLIMRNTHQHE